MPFLCTFLRLKMDSRQHLEMCANKTYAYDLVSNRVCTSLKHSQSNFNLLLLSNILAYNTNYANLHTCTRIQTHTHTYTYTLHSLTLSLSLSLQVLDMLPIIKAAFQRQAKIYGPNKKGVHS